MSKITFIFNKDEFKKLKKYITRKDNGHKSIEKAYTFNITMPEDHPKTINITISKYGYNRNAKYQVSVDINDAILFDKTLMKNLILVDIDHDSMDEIMIQNHEEAIKYFIYENDHRIAIQHYIEEYEIKHC